MDQYEFVSNEPTFQMLPPKKETHNYRRVRSKIKRNNFATIFRLIKQTLQYLNVQVEFFVCPATPSLVLLFDIRARQVQASSFTFRTIIVSRKNCVALFFRKVIQILKFELTKIW